VSVPEDIGLDDVEAAVLGLLDEPRPHLEADGVTGQTARESEQIVVCTGNRGVAFGRGKQECPRVVRTSGVLLG
jgi:hypothetical protein